ncbi:MAG TPA: hypothetical protein VK335_18220 [Bryobacteraceae bacterium]|nr:hypothetical protein [Bryobacteraceae bacterium]
MDEFEGFGVQQQNIEFTRDKPCHVSRYHLTDRMIHGTLNHTRRAYGELVIQLPIVPFEPKEGVSIVKGRPHVDLAPNCGDLTRRQVGIREMIDEVPAIIAAS